MSTALTQEETVSLKQWLIRELEPISDADTDILSDYVLALIKTDSSEAEMEKEITDQLRDFLDSHTDSFVSFFFSALRSKSFITASTSQSGLPSKHSSLPSEPTSSRKRSRSPSSSSQQQTSSSKTSRLSTPGAGLDSDIPTGPRSMQNAEGPSSGNQLSAGGRPGQNFQPNFPSVDPHYQLSQQQQQQYPFAPMNAFPQQNPWLGNNASPQAQFEFQQRAGFFMPGFNGPMPGMGGYGPNFGNQEGMQNAMPGMEDPSNMNQYGGQDQGGQMTGVPMGMGMGMDPNFFVPHTNDPSRGGHAPSGRGRGAPFQHGSGGRQRPNNKDASSHPPKDRNGVTLVVSDIPAQHLSLPAIKTFFSKFGTVTNIAVDQRSSRALVSFASNEEAYKAWKSEEAVFGSRFVKVLWHRPIEGQGGKGKEALEKSKAAVDKLESTPGSSSTVTDELSSGATASSISSSTAAKPGLSKAEALAKQRLLESQIAQQKVLMARLTSGSLNPEEKAALSAQFHKLSDEMKAGTGSLPVAVASSSTTNAVGNRTAVFHPPPSASLTQEGDEKEEDREGEDRELPSSDETSKKNDDKPMASEATEEEMNTDMLKRKLAMLKAEAALLGVDPNDPAASSAPYAAYPPARGRGRGRGIRGRGGVTGGAYRGGFNSYTSTGAPAKSMKLDLRTKRLAIVGQGLGADEEGKAAVERWYDSIGGVESTTSDEGSDKLIVSFKSRALAEKALAKGTNITDLSIPITISWFNTPPSLPIAKPTAASDGTTGPDPSSNSGPDSGVGAAMEADPSDFRSRERDTWDADDDE